MPLIRDFDGDFPSLKSTLESVYSRVGIGCEVTLDAYFEYAAPLLFDKGSGLLSAYNGKMKALNEAYASARGVEKEVSYIFITGYSGGSGKRDFSGFMPLNTQFGYVSRYDFRSLDKFCIAVAHELAHGRFSLRHPFDSSLGLDEGDVSENLMGYRNGLELSKWQWDVMHDPGVVVRLFERDQDAALRPFDSFTTFKEIINVYINNLLNWGIKEGYKLCIERAGRNLTNATLSKYKPNQISSSSIKYIKKFNLMGVNEYSEAIEIDIPNYGKVRMTIELFISDKEEANQILGIDYIGLSISLIHGNPGYFYIFKSQNNRTLGTVNISSKDYDIFSSFLKYYKAKGYDIAIIDLMENEPQQATQLKIWGEEDKKYLHYNFISPISELSIKRIITGENFKLNCE